MPEVTGCHLCGRTPGRVLFAAEDMRHHLPGQFAWNTCPACGLIYLSPRPRADEMTPYYPEDYALFRAAGGQSRRWYIPWMEQRDLNQRCRAAESRPAVGRVLDVGCATGEFLAAMRRRGWSTAGVEPNARAAAYARERLLLDVTTCDLRAADFPCASFDVITLWAVLEHVHDPLGTLRRARALLRPGGLLLFSIPDPGALEARLFGKYWVGFDTPRHLYVYPRPALVKLLARSGFEIWRTEHSLADYYTFRDSLTCWLGNGPVPRSAGQIIWWAAHLPALRLFTWPAFWAINRLGRGSLVTVYARPVHEPDT